MYVYINYTSYMGARRGGESVGRRPPLENLKKKKKK